MNQEIWFSLDKYLVPEYFKPYFLHFSKAIDVISYLY